MIRSTDCAAAGSAGAGMADSICQALTLLRLTLRRRRRTN